MPSTLQIDKTRGPMRAPLALALTLIAAACRAGAGAPPPSASAQEIAPPLPPPPTAQASARSDATLPAPAVASCPPGMALIPGGAYLPLKGRRTAKVEPFCLDRTEVTVAAYKTCVEEGKCSPECLAQRQCSAVPTQARWGDPLESLRASRYCNGDRDDRRDHPVNCVSFEEALKYCEGYKKRLPLPEEWEWAAIGADPRASYPWGRDLPALQLCWSPKASRHDGTCPVESHPVDRSPQGVFDLGGNVSEWAAPKPARAASTPGGAGGKRRLAIAFGASWYAMDDGYVRAALGGIEMPSERNETTGFRCARAPLAQVR